MLGLWCVFGYSCLFLVAIGDIALELDVAEDGRAGWVVAVNAICADILF